MLRRDFVRMGLAGATLGGLGPWLGDAAAIALVADDPLAMAPPVQLALAALRGALRAADIPVRDVAHVVDSDVRELCIVSVTGAPEHFAPESFAVQPTRLADRRAIVVRGADARGLAYALRELADRVHARPSIAALALDAPIVEAPAVPVRSVMRQFTSESLDTPWLHDRAMWSRYLAMLATHRFNRLHLAFGLGYDTLQRVADSYLLFAYPFLVDVGGVRATNVSDADRDRNLATLRWVAEETVRHGLEFELGLWMHGYEMPNSPQARHVVEGLTPATHASYCRDALTAVLRACPAISSVGLRIHGESGIAEGSYDFWGTVFDGVARCGRRVEIDLHAKGIDATMIARAQATGMPVNVSPKFAAEHCGMPYHQAAIRELEMPVAGRTGAGLMTLSEGARVFTRYGYADLLRDDRTYTVRPRVFAGTQRLLAWGDPAWAAASARAFGFCGMTGVDLMEPLTCRGRRGTGVGRRDGYADLTLTSRDDWAKYDAWYRTWGRALYAPTTSSRTSALAYASRILPIVTNAHLPSAACDAYWPEIYWNQPIVEEPRPNWYGDSPPPRTFVHASPLDPQLFSSCLEHADELLGAVPRSGRYSPIDVAAWLETLSARAESELTRATDHRTAIDVRALAALGRFFAAKFRAGVLYAIHERTSDRRALDASLGAYRRARAAWVDVVTVTRGVYQADLSVSDKLSERGQWSDRLAGIDDDIARMAARQTMTDDVRAIPAITEATGAPRRATLRCAHTPPRAFRPGADVTLDVIVAGGAARGVTLHYRHVDQSARWESAAMESVSRGTWRAHIPAAYTDSPYPLQYYLSLSDAAGRAALYPGFDEGLANQPYIVLRRSKA